jgi:hypothetical protein
MSRRTIYYAGGATGREFLCLTRDHPSTGSLLIEWLAALAQKLLPLPVYPVLDLLEGILVPGVKR